MEPEKLSKFSVNELLSKRDLELNIPHDGSMNLYLANKYRKLIELNEVSKELIISDIFTGCACFVNGVYIKSSSLSFITLMALWLYRGYKPLLGRASATNYNPWRCF